MGPSGQLNFEGYVLDHVEMHMFHYNWKTFIEVYLEDYHVEPFHPGLSHFVTCSDLKWEFKPEYQAQRAAYMETVLEDDEIGERMDEGRKALMQRGDNEVGPYQSPMEDGMQHFHEWYRSKMGAHFSN